MPYPNRIAWLSALVGCIICSSLAKGDSIKIHNQTLELAVATSEGSYSIQSVGGTHAFVVKGNLKTRHGQAKVVNATDPEFGTGRCIQVNYPNGDQDALQLFANLPFALLCRTLHNGGKSDLRINSIRPFGAAIDLGIRPSDLRVLSTAGLTTPGDEIGGYEWMAVADPKTRHGIVAGWLTHDRASGAIFARVQDDRVFIQPQLDYGRLRITPGANAKTEILAFGYFDDARLGLEAWASLIARVYHIKLPPKPVGYCTWYSDKHGGASDEKSLVELTAVAAKELRPLGFSLIQIDDGWQDGIKNIGPRKVFTTINPKGPYPSGMKAAADNIAAHGLAPGIWFMPFAGTWDDPFFADYPDWFVKTEDGKPYVTKWGGSCLDMTHPAVQKYLASEVHRISHDWGYRYFKMDGMWTGTATKQIYPNSRYQPDGMGDAVFSNPDKTNIEAYRDGLKLVRQAAGDGVFLLGCCAPQNMRSYGGAFGLIDAMRVGPDNGPGWRALMRGPTYASRSYFLNGRVWWNDPDPVYVRPSVPIEHARLICSWVTIAGDLSLCSEWLPELPAERMDLLKRTIPSHDLPARPVDLFENDPPRLWLLTDDRTEPRRDVIGIYNWTSEPLQVNESLERIGLPGKGPYVAFDYWANAFIPPFEARLRMTLQKESCRVLSVRTASDHPQLISTSRHITQGIVDVISEKWVGDSLSGVSHVVGGDAYELRIVMPDASWHVQSVSVSQEDQSAGVKIADQHASAGVRVRIDSTHNRDVAWCVRFRRS